jgi:hypothetical protein
MTSGTTRAAEVLAPAGAPAGGEFDDPLAVIRHELKALPDPLSRADLQRVLDLARSLRLPDDCIRGEVAEIQASFAALDLTDRIGRGDLPIVESLCPLAADDRCHFVTPVRFGRRRSDQVGHLELTTYWLKFHGALDVNIVWTEVAVAQRSGRDIIVSLIDSKRLLRFSCHALGEAAQGAVMAAYLARTAHAQQTFESGAT